MIYYYSAKDYPNPKVKVKFIEKPHWNTTYYDRNGFLYINNNYLLFEILGLTRSDYVYIQMNANPCFSKKYKEEQTYDPLKGLNATVENRKDMYLIETPNYIQPPTVTKRNDKTISRAIIDLENSVYKTNLTELESERQNALRSGYAKQIDIQIIRDMNNDGTQVQIYKGKNKEQNDQAEEIVNSLTWDCSIETKDPKLD